MPETHDLVACPDCDALQALLRGARHARQGCWRCGTLLDGPHEERLERTLALVIAAGACDLIANLAPLVRVNLQGDEVTTTLAGAAGALWSAGMEPIATLVFVTTVLLPAIYLGTLLYLLGGLLWLEHRPAGALPYADVALRAAQHAQSWSMLEVFLVGALVAVVRLQPVALVNVRPALWAVGALVLLLAALAGSFHPRRLWERLDRTTGPR